MTTLKTASVLAFERKLDPSDAIFSSGRWEDIETGSQWPGIIVREKSVRSTISNRLKSSKGDPAKLDAAIESPNLQTIDIATLPNNADTLRVRFTLKVLGGAGIPSTCNSADYQVQLQKTLQQYVEDNGFAELSHRYAHNLANGRFLWRNRIASEEVKVKINHLKQGEPSNSWCFNALDFSQRNFERPSGVTDEFQSLAQVIESGLSGNEYVLLEVIAYARVGDGQEVYPSQELILDSGSEKKGQKSKTLYSVEGVAGLHSQKVGNALRTIDSWYGDEELVDPIAVEPYGSVTSRGKAYRQPKNKIDFYSLLDDWVLKGKAPEQGHQHFVMAILIRGGVFGSKD